MFVISDITYVLFPIMIIWKLNMPTRRKVGLLVVLAMSLVTMCAALAKITVSLIPMTNNKILGNPAVQYFTSIINFSSDCEQTLVIIMGCIPTLHLASRLRVPSLRELRGNVSKVFGWSSRYGEGKESMQASSTKSSFPNSQKGHSRYHEIQLAPLANASNANSFDSTRRALAPRNNPYVTSQGSLPHLEGNLGGTRVLRTDSVSVSYTPHRRVEEM